MEEQLHIAHHRACDILPVDRSDTDHGVEHIGQRLAHIEIIDRADSTVVHDRHDDRSPGTRDLGAGPAGGRGIVLYLIDGRIVDTISRQRIGACTRPALGIIGGLTVVGGVLAVLCVEYIDRQKQNAGKQERPQKLYNRYTHWVRFLNNKQYRPNKQYQLSIVNYLTTILNCLS